MCEPQKPAALGRSPQQRCNKDTVRATATASVQSSSHRTERSERGLSEDGMICPPGAFARASYCASRSIVVPSNTLLTVRTAHILPHMVQVPSVLAGEAS